MSSKTVFISAISGLEFPEKQKVLGSSILIAIFNLIKEDHPDFNEDEYMLMTN